jgi:hypothetical protein
MRRAAPKLRIHGISIIFQTTNDRRRVSVSLPERPREDPSFVASVTGSMDYAAVSLKCDAGTVTP